MTQAIISFSLYTFKLLGEYRYHEVTGNCTIKFIKNMSFTIIVKTHLEIIPELFVLLNLRHIAVNLQASGILSRALAVLVAGDFERSLTEKNVTKAQTVPWIRYQQIKENFFSYLKKFSKNIQQIIDIKDSYFLYSYLGREV